MYAIMNAYIGQCDWFSNIFTIGMIFLTKKKKKTKKQNLHVLKIAYLHFKFDSIKTMRNI